MTHLVVCRDIIFLVTITFGLHTDNFQPISSENIEVKKLNKVFLKTKIN